MKFLSEYRNPELVKFYLNEIEKIVTKPWNIMEICGGQTHSLVKNGLLELLPDKVRMIHGPGCPVCVTPISLIDKAVALMEKGAVLCSSDVPIPKPYVMPARLGCKEMRRLLKCFAVVLKLPIQTSKSYCLKNWT
jgi:hydrogenase expression/formation protein HypD